MELEAGDRQTYGTDTAPGPASSEVAIASPVQEAVGPGFGFWRLGRGALQMTWPLSLRG